MVLNLFVDGALILVQELSLVQQVRSLLELCLVLKLHWPHFCLCSIVLNCNYSIVRERTNILKSCINCGFTERNEHLFSTVWLECQFCYIQNLVFKVRSVSDFPYILISIKLMLCLSLGSCFLNSKRGMFWYLFFPVVSLFSWHWQHASRIATTAATIIKLLLFWIRSPNMHTYLCDTTVVGILILLLYLSFYFIGYGLFSLRVKSVIFLCGQGCHSLLPFCFCNANGMRSAINQNPNLYV